MTSSEQYIFEDQLSSDPLLKGEFDHQNEIVNGLKEFRKTELKSRLNNISVGPGILGVLTQAATMKSLSYVVTAVLMGTGTYYYLNSSSKQHITEILSVQPRLEFLLPGINYQKRNSDLDYRYSQKRNSSPTILESKEEEEIVAGVKEIDFYVPEVNDESSNEYESEPEQILEKAVSRTKNFVAAGEFNKVDVENVVSNSYKFHYKLDNNKLYLYGRFEASPYEIIEINSFQSKKLFFFYNGDYFELNQNIEGISPLNKIENSNLIDELSILKKKN